MIAEQQIGKDEEGNGRGLFEVLSHSCSAGLGNDQETPSRLPVSWFQRGIFLNINQECQLLDCDLICDKPVTVYVVPLGSRMRTITVRVLRSLFGRAVVCCCMLLLSACGFIQVRKCTHD